MRKIEGYYPKMKKNLKNSRASYAMMAPYLLIFLTFTIIPVVVGFALSFTNYDMLQSPKFVGLDNYVNLFLYDEVFIIALKNTLILAVITGLTTSLIPNIVASVKAETLQIA